MSGELEARNIEESHQLAHWTEDDSREFIESAGIFVPERDQQIETICRLIPAAAEDAFDVVGLGSGDGTLAEAVLSQFPKCRYTALDGSESMRQQLSRTLAPFHDRVEIANFDLAEDRWHRSIRLLL